MSWEKTTIGKVAEVGSSKRIFAKDYEDGGIPFFRSKEIGELSKGEEIRTELFISKEKYQEIKEKYDIPSPGDLLLTSVGSIGNTWIVDDRDFYFKDGNITIIKPGDHLYVRFLQYYFKSDLFWSILGANSTGTAYTALTISNINKLQIPIPPIEEQKKIAAILDTADALRQKDKALIAKYQELTQSLFLDMFGKLSGKKISLDSACEINPKKSEISSLDKGTIVSFIPMGNVTERGNVDLSEEKRVEEVWKGFTYFKEGDVAFAKITPCMENGKGGIMQGLKNGVGFGTTEFHVLRPVKGLTNSAYLYYLSVNKKFRKTAESEMTGSAGQKRVPKSFFSSYKIVLPTLELQNQFAVRVQEIEKQKKQAQQNLKKSEELFNCLLQRAFNGELTKTLEPA